MAKISSKFGKPQSVILEIIGREFCSIFARSYQEFWMPELAALSSRRAKAHLSDAAIIQTHRNPVDVLKSQIQLTQVLATIYARPVARDRLGVSEARTIKRMSDRITRFRNAHRDAAEKFIDITYRELVSDPMGVVRRIYERLDIPLTEAAAERMRHLAAARSRYQKPVASPALAYFALDSAAERERFAGYCSRFGIPC